MEASARLARREYMRQWRLKNKDKVKAHQERYWEKKAQEGRKEVNK
ncbi:hypothetical protein H9660_08740 [Clostridium sp. Sa3CUN1]|uniref:Uncharacterized protein n=1 Tax=Clostridium gallinarum TaxID=2762246 RepID=A0ABR8Q474_9CLOT|nr:hypothetical protein [Clostridium gallinarum]MBD7915232.1 hypothetical protein [Clostridium gallinarum]